VVFPSSPEDAKGLLLASFEDPNPVMFFEHKALYRTLESEVPKGHYTIPIGKANLVSEGTDFTIITYGQAVHWAKEHCEAEKLNADILDLRTLQPLDYESISRSVAKTNRVIIFHEDTLFGGIGSEIAAYISEHLFDKIDAPVIRAASLDTPVPFTPSLEEIFLPKDRLKTSIKKLLEY